MKYVKVEPQFKKCVTDTTTWKKVIEGETAYLTKCETYRGGSFLINVPETPEEIKECLAYRDMTLSEAYEYFGEDFDLNELWLPNPDEDWVEMGDYQAELLDMYDGCATDWNLILSDDIMSEEDQEELLDKLEMVYDEEHDLGIAEEGWEECDCVQEIHCELTLSECDEYGNVLEESE